MLTAGSTGSTGLTDGRAAGSTRRARWWTELLLGLGLFGVYLLIKFLPLPANLERAQANGEAILALERFLALDFELPVNLWLADQGWLRVAANYEYAYTYIITTLILLVWVFARRPEHYRWVRNSFLWMNLLALGVFWIFPVAPPRMLPDAGFVDTVRLGRTWGSWGSPMVDNANQLAAMPSLHIGWALWVSVVLARIAGGWLVQVVSAVHVLVTFVVIVATGNHYWLDAVGGAVVVWLGVALTGVGRRQADRLTPGEARLLATANGACGALALLDTSRGSQPGPEQVKALVGARLADRPRLRQRPPRPGRRRPRWLEHPRLDWAWHVPVFDLSRPGGTAALHRLVADLAAEPLPGDRPLWRVAVVTGVADDVAAVVTLVHPALADEAGAVELAFDLLGGTPVPGSRERRPTSAPPPPSGRAFTALCLDPETRPGALSSVLGRTVPVLTGPAGQLRFGELPVTVVVPVPLPADGVSAVALDRGGVLTVGALAADGDIDRFGAKIRAELPGLRLDSRRG
ncbi:hypothetical protein DI005_19775 [Prauserella sp. PE36]|uniref:bifunctional phosphatase PAP2/O-acyltransferase family protein n=1 Tax=Prauserella sp. PE36 TaxID=1504709 RepID=UPI000DE48983|nr:phosphatase PAP2 family protein [Prauserella sp. PE36]RBM18182.1 hypothetical protein DI005_19775 [Prauserella sp. PE36]